jgi:hypothetical protein
MDVKNKDMKKTSIIIGGLIGLLYSFIEPLIRYSDTAPLNDEIGLDIPSWKTFTIESISSISIGALIGWIIYLIVNKISYK